MNRYFQSFLLAAFIYSSLFGAMFFSSGMETKSAKAKNVQKINMQAYQSAAPKQPPKETKPAPKPQPKPTPKPQPKEKPKPKPEKKPKKTEKKTVQKKPAHQPKKEHKKPVKKIKPQRETQANKETAPRQDKLQVAKAINQSVQTFDQIKKNLLQKRTKAYLNALKQQLQKYKQYPRVAQRRGWQDEVKLTFSINSHDEIVIKAAKSQRDIFAKYGKKALRQAFESMQNNQQELHFPINANIALRYKLN